MPRTSAYVSPFESLINRNTEEGTAPSRRSFLRLSGYLSGGLVLPLAGTKAIALTNPAQADAVDVAPVAMPVSDDLVRLRSLARGYSRLRRLTWDNHRRGIPKDKSEREIVETIIQPEHQRVERQAAAMIARPCSSWADVGELAEIAWLAAPKDNCPIGPRTGQLQRGNWRRCGPNPHDFVHDDDVYLCATAALIEAVLTMTGGQRFDMYAERTESE